MLIENIGSLILYVSPPRDWQGFTVRVKTWILSELGAKHPHGPLSEFLLSSLTRRIWQDGWVDAPGVPARRRARLPLWATEDGAGELGLPAHRSTRPQKSARE